MATSSVEICNDALIIIGANKIAALSDSTKEAVLCNEQYDKVRKQLLSSHPWNFASYRTQIAADSDLPTNHWDWEYAHSLTSDVLRVLDLQYGDDYGWVIEHGTKVFTNHTPINILYIKNVTDTTIFPAYFEKALAFALADRLCYALTQSATLQERIGKQYEAALRDARSMDAQEKSLQQVGADDYIASRF